METCSTPVCLSVCLSVCQFKYIGKRVRKKFGRIIYAGVVKQYKKPYLLVEYEDGDTEDQTEAEVKRILV